jgi:hypothetical protein
MHIHIVLFGLYKISHIYLVLRIIIILCFVLAVNKLY